jgi:tetratricopeptide (TPR) repeat protein
VTEALQQEIRTLRSLLDSPRDPGGRVFAPLADAYRRAGRIPEALRVLNEGLAKHPDFATGHVVAARLYVEQGLGAEGALAARRALELDGENVLALRALARALDESGDAGAREVRERLLVLEPDFTPDWVVAASVAAVVPAEAAPDAPTIVVGAFGLTAPASAPAPAEPQAVGPREPFMPTDAIDLGSLAPLPAADLPISALGPEPVPVLESVDLGLPALVPADAPLERLFAPEGPEVMEFGMVPPPEVPAAEARAEPVLDLPLLVPEPVGAAPVMELAALAPDEEEVVALAALAPDAPAEEPVMELAALAPDAEQVVSLAALAPDSPAEEPVMELAALAPDEEEVVALAALAPDAVAEEPVMELAALAPDAPAEEPVMELAALAPDEEEVVSLAALAPDAPAEEPVMELAALAPDAEQVVSLAALAPDAPAEEPVMELAALAQSPGASYYDEPVFDLDTLAPTRAGAQRTASGPEAGASDDEAVDIAFLSPGQSDEIVIDLDVLRPEAPAVQGAPAADATTTTEEQGHPVFTRTLAELYASQGAVKQAIEVLKHLQTLNPSDPELARRVAELEAAGPAEAAAPTAARKTERDEELEALARDLAESGAARHEVDTPFAWADQEPEAANATGPTIRDYFEGLLSWEPRER